MAFGPDRDTYANRVGFDAVGDARSEVKFANRASTGTTEVPLWDGGTTYEFIDAPESIDIVSTSVNDTLAGTGAQIIKVIGQASGDWVIEEVNMNGTTPVTLSNQMDYVHRLIVIQAGATAPVVAAIAGSTGAAGTITVTATGTGTDLGQITNGNNITLQSMVRVPTGEKWQLIRGILTGGINKEITFRLYIRLPGTTIFALQAVGSVVEGGLDIEAHTMYDSGTDLIVTAQSDTAATSASSLFQFIRHRKDDLVGQLIELT